MFAKIQLSSGEHWFVSSGADGGLVFTDGAQVWTATNGDCDLLQPSNGGGGLLFSLENSNTVLVIKSTLGAGMKRRGEVTLTPVADPHQRQQMVCAVMDGAAREQIKRDEEIAKLEQQRAEMQGKLIVYSQQLLSKVLDREQTGTDLMQRFLPILNAKKERIRELLQRLEEFEDQGPKVQSLPAVVKVKSEPETKRRKKQIMEEEEEEEAPVAKRAKPTASREEEEDLPTSTPQNEPSNVKEEEVLPAGWIKTTSRSQPGKACYQNTATGVRQFDLPQPAPLPLPPSAASAAPTKDKNDDSFLSEFF
ncbi:hypothetical protein BASA81_002221 [Batrachochytrium salamandrivorans]|nr:hypothetical protein BASA81_002221 [Batrachochytrium salamandrivorans]